MSIFVCMKWKYRWNNWLKQVSVFIKSKHVWTNWFSSHRQTLKFSTQHLALIMPAPNIQHKCWVETFLRGRRWVDLWDWFLSYPAKWVMQRNRPKWDYWFLHMQLSQDSNGAWLDVNVSCHLGRLKLFIGKFQILCFLFFLFFLYMEEW